MQRTQRAVKLLRMRPNPLARCPLAPHNHDKVMSEGTSQETKDKSFRPFDPYRGVSHLGIRLAAESERLLHFVEVQP